MKIKINIDLKVGRVVKYFVLADLALLAGWGLIGPLFSIYVIGKVEGATLITVGLAASIYWILKSILQLPIAKYLDNHVGEGDDFRALIIGLFISSFTALAFILINQTWQLYLVEIIHATAFAFYTPAWSAIFSRHLDKDRVSFDWSLDSTAVGLAAGVSGFFGGVIANWLGFQAVFILAAVFSSISALIFMATPDLILPKKTSKEIISRDQKPISVPN